MELIGWWGLGGSHAAPVVSSHPGGERGARLTYSLECGRSGERAAPPDLRPLEWAQKERRPPEASSLAVRTEWFIMTSPPG
jgi:hypothetical protein